MLRNQYLTKLKRLLPTFFDEMQPGESDKGVGGGGVGGALNGGFNPAQFGQEFAGDADSDGFLYDDQEVMASRVIDDVEPIDSPSDTKKE